MKPMYLLFGILFILAIAGYALFVYADTNHPTCGTPATGSNCIGGNATQDTCIDTTGNNAMDSTDTCHDDVECFNGHIGVSCDQSPGTTGICAKNSGTTAICGTTPVSGEYGTGLGGGTAINFHSGNENSSCTSGTEAMGCSTTGGYDPSTGGACDGVSCMMSGALDCRGLVCSTSDVTAATYVSSCDGTTTGWSCDSSIGTGGYAQDGICIGGGTPSCQTTGYVCNGTGIIQANGCGAACFEGDPCDATYVGNFDPTYGTCVSGVCTAATNAVPNVTTPIFNDTFVMPFESITANTTYSDVEGNLGSVYFEWWVNGVSKRIESYTSVANNTALRSNFTIGNFTSKDKVNVSVNASDANGNSNKHNSLLLTIQDCPTLDFFNSTNNKTLWDVNCIGDSQVAGDLSIFQRIIFKIGTFIESVKAGWIRVSASLNVINDLLVNRDANISGSLLVNGINITGASSSANYTINSSSNWSNSGGNGTVTINFDKYAQDSDVLNNASALRQELVNTNGTNAKHTDISALMLVNGTGQDGRVAIWNGTSTVTRNTNLTFNGTTSRLGIGTDKPSQKLHVEGHTNITGNLTIAGSFHIDKINSSTIRMWFG